MAHDDPHDPVEPTEPGPEPRRPLLRLGATGQHLGKLDLRNTWQVFVGAALAAAGLLLIVVGYAGVAHAPLVQEQLPYLASGSILGLAFVVLGGFLFWAHWLYRQYERNEYHQLELRRLLTAVLAQGDRRLSEGNGSAQAAPTPDMFVVRTEKGRAVHRPDCSVVASMGAAGTVPTDEARSSGMQPCRICEPFAADPTPAGPPGR